MSPLPLNEEIAELTREIGEFGTVFDGLIDDLTRTVRRLEREQGDLKAACAENHQKLTDRLDDLESSSTKKPGFFPPGGPGKP